MIKSIKSFIFGSKEERRRSNMINWYQNQMTYIETRPKSYCRKLLKRQLKEIEGVKSQNDYPLKEEHLDLAYKLTSKLRKILNS